MSWAHFASCFFMMNVGIAIGFFLRGLFAPSKSAEQIPVQYHYDESPGLRLMP